MFSAAEYAQGKEASSASVKRHAMACVRRRYPGELREGAVAFRTKIDGSSLPCEVRDPEYRLHQDALADPLRVDAVSHGNDMPAGVGALNSRECRRRTGPAGVVRAGRCDSGGASLHRRAFGDGSGIPSGARIDVGIVHAGCADADEDLAGARRRDRHVDSILELLESAVSLEKDRLHCRSILQDSLPVSSSSMLGVIIAPA
jgi:hypothetical protein